MSRVPPAGAGPRPTAPFALVITPSGRLGLQRAAGPRARPPASARTFDTGEDETARAAAGRRLHGRRATARRSTLAGRDERLRRGHRLRLRPPRRRGRRVVQRGGGRFALPARPRDRRLTAALRPGRGRPGRAARRRAVPAGRSTTSARPATFDGRPADRRRGAHPGRQLVVLPAAQARRGPRRRGPSWRRSTTSRSRRPTARARLPAGLRPRAGPRDRRARRGAQRRRRADPARLARPVDGRARLRPLLPQRHGRARRASGPG